MPWISFICHKLLFFGIMGKIIIDRKSKETRRLENFQVKKNYIFWWKIQREIHWFCEVWVCFCVVKVGFQKVVKRHKMRQNSFVFSRKHTGIDFLPFLAEKRDFFRKIRFFKNKSNFLPKSYFWSPYDHISKKKDVLRFIFSFSFFFFFLFFLFLFCGIMGKIIIDLS